MKHTHLKVPTGLQEIITHGSLQQGGPMADQLREYLDAEIRTIIGAMDESCLCDPELLQRRTLEWIEQNAEHFREHWNRTHLVHQRQAV